MRCNMCDRRRRRLIRIALFGAPCNNKNMGCLALTYSLIQMLENISNDIGQTFEYYIFEAEPDDNKIKEFAKNLKLKNMQIKAFPLFYISDAIRFFVYMKKNMPILKELRSCDIAIDMTQGDSFTDIYGSRRFQVHTNTKLLIEKIGIPLILGPQTYGPFNSDKLSYKAGKAIRLASLVLARDKLSAKVASKLSGKQVEISVDLAFQLPYMKKNNHGRHRLKVGVNISGLLIKNKSEATDTDFLLKTDYDEYIERILTYLETKDYDVFLIPHVSEDCDAIKKFHCNHDSMIFIDMFTTPMKAKNFISDLDFFIGARMHATIAGISSGVPTLPIAYSRKFKGLFSLIEYKHIIDLQELDTETAVNNTIHSIENMKNIKLDVDKSRKKANLYADKTERVIKETILQQIRFDENLGM